ncbi:MAG TPA: multicopper oxidase domain-containing protein, partial [Gaiellaceae bacterium]|nr:multicopper oxidase domain-containing protein [Gaiellaceae bacterium]
MNGLSRRRFLEYGIGAGAALLVPPLLRPPGALAARGGALRRYVQPVPLPGHGVVVAAPKHGSSYAFVQRQIERQLHPDLPPTPVWAYDDGSGLAAQAGSFGMAIAAERDVSIEATFTNRLPEVYPEWIPDDRRLLPSDDDTVRLMTHLHGGFVSAADDGNPCITPNGFAYGEAQRVSYPNAQAASLLWFHDHGLGATRLNVFAGLAGAYILRDEYDTGAEPNPAGLPGGAYELPLVIQDRLFNADGTFLYPRSLIGSDVSWIGEYFGDTMLVNGKVWPYVEVEPRLYRLRLLNGCNARILNLHLGGVPMWQVGGDLGLWDKPMPLDGVVLAPAERADLVVDFSRSSGQTLILTNSPPRPPVSTPAPPLPHVMQIRVGTRVTHLGPASVPASLPGIAADLLAATNKRFITLNEVNVDQPDWYLNLNGDSFMDGPAATETPTAGAVEDWHWVNLTADTHPMHIHLVGHQVVGRIPFDARAYTDAAKNAGAWTASSGVRGGFDPSAFYTGPMQPPDPAERGFKDTTKAHPGFVTVVRARFDLPPG